MTNQNQHKAWYVFETQEIGNIQFTKTNLDNKINNKYSLAITENGFQTLRDYNTRRKVATNEGDVVNTVWHVSDGNKDKTSWCT